jgi:hypothetical protein
MTNSSPKEACLALADAMDVDDGAPHRGSGGRGHRSPRLPRNPGVTVSRHRAPLIRRSVPADPLPVGEQAAHSFDQPGPPPFEPSLGPQPSVSPCSPAPQVGADAQQKGRRRGAVEPADPSDVRHLGGRVDQIAFVERDGKLWIVFLEVKKGGASAVRSRVKQRQAQVRDAVVMAASCGKSFASSRPPTAPTAWSTTSGASRRPRPPRTRSTRACRNHRRRGSPGSSARRRLPNQSRPVATQTSPADAVTAAQLQRRSWAAPPSRRPHRARDQGEYELLAGGRAGARRGLTASAEGEAGGRERFARGVRSPAAYRGAPVGEGGRSARPRAAYRLVSSSSDGFAA